MKQAEIATVVGNQLISKLFSSFLLKNETINSAFEYLFFHFSKTMLHEIHLTFLEADVPIGDISCHLIIPIQLL